jgi:hypothetical protein
MVVYQPCNTPPNIGLSEVPTQTKDKLLALCLSADHHGNHAPTQMGATSLKFDKGGGDVCWNLVTRFKGADQLPVFAYNDTGDLMVYGVLNDSAATIQLFKDNNIKGHPTAWQQQYGGMKVSSLPSGWGAMYKIAWDYLYNASQFYERDDLVLYDSCKECSGAGGEAAVTIEFAAVSAATLTKDFGTTEFNRSVAGELNSDVVLDAWYGAGPDILKCSRMEFRIYNNNPVISDANCIRVKKYNFEAEFKQPDGSSRWLTAETDKFAARDEMPMHVIDQQISPPRKDWCVIGGGDNDGKHMLSNGTNSKFGLSRIVAPDNVAHYSAVVPSKLFNSIEARNDSANIFRCLTTESDIQFNLTMSEIEASNSLKGDKLPDWKNLCPHFEVKGKFKIPDYDYAMNPAAVPAIYSGSPISRSTSMSRTIDLGVIDDKSTAIVAGLAYTLDIVNKGIGSLIMGRKSWKIEYLDTLQTSQQIDQTILQGIVDDGLGVHGTDKWEGRKTWNADTQGYGYAIHGGVSSSVQKNVLRINPMNFKLGKDVDGKELGANEAALAKPGTYGVEIVYGIMNIAGPGEGFLGGNLPVVREELPDTFTLSILWSFPAAFYQEPPQPPRPPRRGGGRRR